MLKPLLGRTFQLVIGIPLVRDVALSLWNAYRRSANRPQLSFARVGGRLVVAEAPPQMPDAPRFEAVAELNVVDTSVSVTTDFLGRLGIDPWSTPTVQLLAAARAELAATAQGTTDGSPLVRLEIAWNRFLAGDVDAALPAFRDAVDDAELCRLATVSGYARDALLRCVDIVGREAERNGDGERAANLYERFVGLDNSGLLTRRLTLLFWRLGSRREALVWSDRVLQADPALADGYLRDLPVRRAAARLAAAR